MKVAVNLPFISWRGGRPRFSPGPRERRLGFRGEDLRYPNGSWFTLIEAQQWAKDRQRQIIEARALGPGRHVIKAVLPKRAAKRRGFVYFLRAGESIKIGFSENPLRRVRELSTAMADHRITIAAIPGSQSDELRLHALLAEHRRDGEWFFASAFVLDVLLRSIARGSIAFP